MLIVANNISRILGKYKNQDFYLIYELNSLEYIKSFKVYTEKEFRDMLPVSFDIYKIAFQGKNKPFEYCNYPKFYVKQTTDSIEQNNTSGNDLQDTICNVFGQKMRVMINGKKNYIHEVVDDNDDIPNNNLFVPPQVFQFGKINNQETKHDCHFPQEHLDKLLYTCKNLFLVDPKMIYYANHFMK